MSSADTTESSLLRALGAYIRATPATELPGRLRPLRGFTPRGLARHREALLAALDDHALRARIGEWLDDKPPLARVEAELLKQALARGDEWRALLASEKTRSPAKAERPTRDPKAEVERERQKARAARDELRSAREEGRRALNAERAAHADTAQALREASTRVQRLEAAVTRAEDEAQRAKEMLERERRKARADAERSRERLEDTKGQLRAARAQVRTLEARVAELEKKDRPAPGASRAERGPQRRAGRRRPLRVPKGLLPEYPETLEVWLTETEGLRLLIDGYNVTLAEGGFAGLDLESQRARLVQEVGRVARKYDVHATVVFDGSSVAPGTFRRPRGPVEVQYSKPPEKADDHLVELLKSLPPDPVVVITNDRELRDRVSAHGATVAGSGQLLALLR